MDPTEVDIGKTTLLRDDLRLFYKTLPFRLLINDENFELDCDFLNFLYNLIENYDTEEYPYKMELGNGELMSILVNLRRRVQLADSGQVVLSRDDTYTTRHGNDKNRDSDDEYDSTKRGHYSKMDIDEIGNKLTDIQGLFWDTQEQRERFLKIRELKHNSFTNVSNSKERARDDINVELDDDMDNWKFKQYLKTPKPKLSHFQLRNNLVCLNSKKEIFYNEICIGEDGDFNSNVTSHPTIKKINTFNGEISTVLDMERDSMERISTIECNDSVLLVGTLSGSYYIKNLITDETQKKVLTTSSNGIINFIRVLDDSILFSANEGVLMNVDLRTLQKKSEVSFPWAINSISMCPFNDNVKLIVGDNINSFLIDERVHLNKPVNILKGHKDFSFCCDWSKDGMRIVTGNQDATVRLYDVRNLKENQFCISGEIDSSIRTVGFNETSDLLVFTESIDYVNILDLNSLEKGSTGSKQVISLFGKSIGSKFTRFDDEDGELLTIGISDDSIGGILQYELKSSRQCMEYDFI